MLEEDIIGKAYEICDEIKKLDEYKRLLDSYNALVKDDDSKRLIDEFDNKRELYERNLISDREMSEIKTKLYSSPLYVSYIDALRRYNDMTKEIEDEINSSIFSDDTKRLVRMK